MNLGNIFSTIAAVLGIITTVGLVVGGIGFLISYFNKGKRQENSEVLSSADQLTNYWKEQVDGYKTVNGDLQEKLRNQAEDFNVKLQEQSREFNLQLQKMSNEFGQLKGQYDAEKAQNERLEKIFQNRDPESQKFMEIMIGFVETQGKINAETARILGEIHSMTKAEHDRDFKITSTIHKEPL